MKISHQTVLLWSASAALNTHAAFVPDAVDEAPRELKSSPKTQEEEDGEVRQEVFHQNVPEDPEDLLAEKPEEYQGR